MNNVPSLFPSWQLALLLVGCAALSAVADILIHVSARDSTLRPLVIGSVLGIGSLLLLRVIFLQSTHSFSIVIVLIVVIHLMIDVGFDVFIYRNRLSRNEWLGIVLAVGALILLTSGKK